MVKRLRNDIKGKKSFIFKKTFKSFQTLKCLLSYNKIDKNQSKY